MSLESIDKNLRREEDILYNDFENGNISIEEYHKQIRDLERDARDYAQEEAEQAYEDYFHN